MKLKLKQMRPCKTILLLTVAVLLSCQSVGDAFSDSETGDPKPSPAPDATTVSPSARWNKELIDTTGGADYLTEVERQVVVEINMLRTDPAQYAATYIKPLRKYYRGRLLQYPGETAIQTTEGIRAVDECIKALSSTRPLGVLSPKRGLSLAARDQARDQARTGATGHTGSDGSSTTTRINRYGKWNRAAGENIDYGNGQARRIVISFLVDDGVPSRGHRMNLLDAAFAFVGVAVGPHPKYRRMCVLDFAGEYE